MPAPRRSRSAIRTLDRKSWGVEATLRGTGAATASAPRSSTAGSTATSTSSRPARSRTTCRSSSIARTMRAISASSSKARCGWPNRRGHRQRRRRRRLCAGDDRRRRPGAAHPAARLLGGLEAQSERINGRVEVEWVGDQDRTADFETDRRLHHGQRLARFPSLRRPERQLVLLGEQHLRRRGAAARQLPQGLCAARRTRPQDQRPGHLLRRPAGRAGARRRSARRSGESARRSGRRIKLTETPPLS